MNNILLGVIALALVLGGWYFFTTNDVADESAPVDTLVDSEVNPEEVDLDVSEDMADDGSVVVEANEVTFDITGTNYDFDQKEMRVQLGDTVTVNFESAEGFHDWVVDEFDAATEQVRPGMPTSVTFVADEVGTFEYYCSVGSHRAQGMVGTLIVE